MFVTREWDYWDSHGQTYEFNHGLARTAAHELTHCLLDTAGQNGFDDREHLADPDENGTPDEAADKIYLMYRYTTADNVATIVFSNPTRRQLDLTSKQSVER